MYNILINFFMKNLSSIGKSKIRSSKNRLTPEELASIKGGINGTRETTSVTSGGCACCICYTGQGGAGDYTAKNTGNI